MSVTARGIRFAATLLLATIALGGLASAAEADQTELPASFVTLGFYGDGGCSGPGSWCGQSWDINFLIEVPRFDDALGQLESITLSSSFLFEATAEYSIVESAIEVAPSVSGRHNGESSARTASQCVGLPVGTSCAVDYGVFSQDYVEVLTSQPLYEEGDPYWYWDEYWGGIGHEYGYQAIGESDQVFLEAPEMIVTYSYTPVPEPSTALLLGLGLTVMARSRACARGGSRNETAVGPVASRCGNWSSSASRPFAFRGGR